MSAKRYIVPMETMKFSFDKNAQPAVTVNPGDEITFYTEDANVSYITKESDIVWDFDKMYRECGGCNPISGPVYVAGAKRGGYLAVEILSVNAGGERGGGYSAVYPGCGALTSAASIQEPLEARTKICGIEGGKGIFKTHDGKKSIHFDLNPFVGTIGVAPVEYSRSAMYHGRDYAGNIDCPDVKAGATVVLPCNHDGGLLSIGDVHAAQGDGEITTCALECRGEVKVRVSVLSAAEARYCRWPQVNTSDYIGAIICNEMLDMGEQIRIGYVELVDRMHAYYGFDKMDAYQLLGLVGKVQVGQVLQTSNSCVVKIEKKYLD